MMSGLSAGGFTIIYLDVLVLAGCVWVEKGERMGMGGGGVKDCMSWRTGRSKFSCNLSGVYKFITREYCQLIWLLVTLPPMTNAAF